MPNPIIERAARALYGEPELAFIRDCANPSALPEVRERPPHDADWEDARPEVREAFRDQARAVLRTIREPLSNAAVYLVADAEAWETGAKDHPHEAYLMHCGKLRRDVAAGLQPLLDVALGEE